MRTIEESMVEFAARWRRLPVLVRAGLASELLLRSARAADVERQHAVTMTDAGLDRRAVVRMQFAYAHEAVEVLFTDLTAQADAEAAARGIDLDTSGEELTLATLVIP